MNLLLILLQTQLPEKTVKGENYLDLATKGGPILIPIFLLLLVAVYVIIERWVVLNGTKSKDDIWLERIKDLIKDGKPDKALAFTAGLNYSSTRVIRAGLEDMDSSLPGIENTMQSASRQEIARLEDKMNYLGITAAIAPMLGFVGTIFGVIKIFYNISVTNDLSIANISDGLYQKMICSGAGLFVGIIAYTGFYLLNGRIDKVVNQMDKDANNALKDIRFFKEKKPLTNRENEN